MSKIELTDNQKNHIGNALLFMCRYSYPRKTSADMACNSALKALWEYVPEHIKKMIVDEIKCEIDLNNTANDPIIWEDFLKWEMRETKDE